MPIYFGNDKVSSQYRFKTIESYLNVFHNNDYNNTYDFMYLGDSDLGQMNENLYVSFDAITEATRDRQTDYTIENTLEIQSFGDMVGKPIFLIINFMVGKSDSNESTYQNTCWYDFKRAIAYIGNRYLNMDDGVIGETNIGSEYGKLLVGYQTDISGSFTLDNCLISAFLMYFGDEDYEVSRR